MRLIIADDHPISRSGLEFLLSGEEGLDLVGIAGDGDEVLALAAELLPDAIVLDLMLPKTPGLVVLERLRDLAPATRVIAISGQASGLVFQQALDFGAGAVVSKEDNSDELLAAIRAVEQGEHYRSSRVAELLGRLVPGGDEPALTARERQVLAMVAAGRTNVEIGEQLAISPSTAKKHRENIRSKLGVSSAVEAAHAAARLGLGPAD